ncbi:hypothetical protein C2G38_2186720 [Gigaspora rosea]|uniref:Uncharacterized protein n=1 Tax=Gigaspora rosea TaxID=44941 RepID=A0A397V5G5_9GLOM|nr:hypothetical protein C2G38_2186720 [Gigaspora rosea]
MKKNIQSKKNLETIKPVSNNNTEESTFASYIEILTKALYQIQRIEGANLELDLVKFEHMIEATNPQLKGFFNYLMNAIIPKECSAYNLEVGLYLMASGVTWEAINTMSTLGYSVCAKTVEKYRKQIKKKHSTKIENHFIENKNLFHVYNIDDYHAIYENHRPDTVSTSTANHFATCVAKLVIEHFSVQLTFNGVSVHNPENVEARIRANTSKNATAENIIKQAYVIIDHDPVFKDTYCKTRQYLYNATTLDFLYEKWLFSITIFSRTTNKTFTKKTPAKASAKKTSTKEKKKTPEIYQLATLKEEVDLRYLPMAYSTSHSLHPELCDCCGLPLSDDNSMVYVCGHSYHDACYNKKCKYCEEYYKREIFENVNSFLKQIEKGENKLMKEDLDDNENDVEEGADEVSEKIEEALDTSSRLVAEIYKIENW